MTQTLPVAIVGAGPVGLAAAAHLLSRGLRPVVLEAGDGDAANVRDWGHVPQLVCSRQRAGALRRPMECRPGRSSFLSISNH
jgi:2-polyprenyl-6-methoxyphenol hydroxylase-like FAD-dependent oxidoreductase